jgi:hypothetical protein
MNPTSSGLAGWWRRVREYVATTRLICAEPGCRAPAFPGYELCIQHFVQACEQLGDQACAKTSCVSAKYKASPWCREHFEQDAFGPTRRRQPGAELRRATPVLHRRPVPGLEISYESFLDPASAGRYVMGPRRVEFEVNERRRRLYLFAYLDGRHVGHLSLFLHTNDTAMVRMISVDSTFQRRGIASALFDVFRAEHAAMLVDHGSQSHAAQAWWAAYCASRDLDPRNPRS